MGVLPIPEPRSPQTRGRDRQRGLLRYHGTWSVTRQRSTPDTCPYGCLREITYSVAPNGSWNVYAKGNPGQQLRPEAIDRLGLLSSAAPLCALSVGGLQGIGLILKLHVLIDRSPWARHSAMYSHMFVVC